jgi:very-short-patch-repair endonuclease
MTSNARTLRNTATAEERLLWTYLRHIRPRFTRQIPIGAYIVDFACRTAKVAVELDGSQHLDAMAYDAERTIFLESLGWQILRFWNSDVRDDAEGIVTVIASTVDARLGRAHPRPHPIREGC